MRFVPLCVKVLVKIFIKIMDTHFTLFTEKAHVLWWRLPVRAGQLVKRKEIA